MSFEVLYHHESTGTMYNIPGISPDIDPFRFPDAHGFDCRKYFYEDTLPNGEPASSLPAPFNRRRPYYDLA